jgi:hypothetical protein
MALRRGCVLVAALLVAAAARGQTEESRTLELDGGTRVTYTLRTYPADAHLVRPATELAPTSALNAAKLLNLHLSTGDIEEAALLSNSPRRRFEELRKYRELWGEEEFKRVFAQYFAPENRLIAEIGINNHRLLVWNLKLDEQANGASSYVAGQFFVEIDGRYLMDDVPNDERASLRQVLEAYRAGKIPR